MTSIQKAFKFQGHPIRVCGTWDVPLFVLTDVCKVLGLSNPTMVATTLDEDEVTLNTIEGKPVNLITEPGLYQLIFQSRKPEARAFKNWVFTEVLPSIRKTGRYELPKLMPKPDQVLVNQVLCAKERLKNHLNSLPEGKLSEDMTVFGRVYQAVSLALWDTSIGGVKSYLGLHTGEFDVTGVWWMYLDPGCMEVFATAIDSASGLVYERNESILEIRDRIEHDLRELGVSTPTLKIGDTERTIPTPVLLLAA